MDVESLVRQAQDGNKEALEVLVVEIQDNIYYLALRMLANPQDAQDAAQEIIIRVITKLSTFQFRSSFRTWVYRVAANYLLDTRKARARQPALSFDQYKEDLEQDLEAPVELEDTIDYPLMLNEVRISCTVAMLLCLNKPHRLAYILGEIFELDHNESSEILGISRANFRKQLSRARSKVMQFTLNSCGIVSAKARCSCAHKMKGAIRRERVNPAAIQFAHLSESSYLEVQQRIAETQDDLKPMMLQTSIPRFKSPADFGQMIESLVNEAYRFSAS